MILLILGSVLKLRILSTIGIVVLIIGLSSLSWVSWVTLWVDANWY